MHITATDQSLTVDEVTTIYGTNMQFWVGTIAELPTGIHWLSIQGNRGSSGVSGIQIDDLEIAKCSSFAGTYIEMHLTTT